MADAILKVISTVGSKASKIPVNNGQLIFVRDTRTIYMDMDNLRTSYTQIQILATDTEREAILAPVSGFYYVLSSNSIWYYSEKWDVIAKPSENYIVSAESYLDFPTQGDSKILYIDETANKTYRWDDTQLKYFVVGSDYNDIEVINGGGA